MLKIDDSVRIYGGKSKKCEGLITDLKNVFVMVRLTKDKKGQPLFVDKSIKVKKIYCEVIQPPPLEMPSFDDLVQTIETLTIEKDEETKEIYSFDEGETFTFELHGEF